MKFRILWPISFDGKLKTWLVQCRYVDTNEFFKLDVKTVFKTGKWRFETPRGTLIK